MPSNNPSNNVKHKVNGYDIEFSKKLNKWVTKLNDKTECVGSFKECRTHAKKINLPPKDSSDKV